jgi:hypothetical protein
MAESDTSKNFQKRTMLTNDILYINATIHLVHYDNEIIFIN